VTPFFLHLLIPDTHTRHSLCSLAPFCHPMDLTVVISTSATSPSSRQALLWYLIHGFLSGTFSTYLEFWVGRVRYKNYCLSPSPQASAWTLGLVTTIRPSRGSHLEMTDRGILFFIFDGMPPLPIVHHRIFWHVIVRCLVLWLNLVEYRGVLHHSFSWRGQDWQKIIRKLYYCWNVWVNFYDFII